MSRDDRVWGHVSRLLGLSWGREYRGISAGVRDRVWSGVKMEVVDRTNRIVIRFVRTRTGREIQR